MDLVNVIIPGNDVNYNNYNVDNSLESLDKNIKRYEDVYQNSNFGNSGKEAEIKLVISQIFKKFVFNYILIALDKIKNVSFKSCVSTFNIQSVKFIENNHIYRLYDEEKYCALLVSLVIYNNELNEFFKLLLQNTKLYNKDAFLLKEKVNILASTEKISSFNFSNIDNTTFSEFKKFIHKKVAFGNEKDFESKEKHPKILINKVDTNSDSFLKSPVKLNFNMLQSGVTNNQKMNMNIYSNLSLNFNNIVSKGNPETSNNLFNPFSEKDNSFILNFIRDDNLGFIDFKDDKIPEETKDKFKDIEEEKELLEKDNIHKIYYHNTKDIEHQNFVNNHNKHYKKFNENQSIEDKFIVNKVKDIAEVINSNYFTNIFYKNDSNDKTKNDLINRQKNPYKFLNSYNNPDLNKIGNSNSDIININTKNLFCAYEEMKRESYFNAKIKIIRKFEINRFTLNDIVQMGNTQIKLTNSIIYFLNYYYKKEKFFLFPTKLITDTPVSIYEQNFQCYICFCPFEFVLGIPKDKIYWCSYLARYVCKDCISDEYSIIPAFVLKSWDFNKYSISKFGRDIIKQWENKPIIHIKSKNEVIKLSSLLKQAITTKRKIHKIFDIMTCEKVEEIIKEILGKYDYLVFKENYFSLDDLCGINDFSTIAKFYDFFRLLEKHVKQDCQKCFVKGECCFICNKDSLMIYNVENTRYCPKCKIICHKKCSQMHSCFIFK